MSSPGRGAPLSRKAAIRATAVPEPAGSGCRPSKNRWRQRGGSRSAASAWAKAAGRARSASKVSRIDPGGNCNCNSAASAAISPAVSPLACARSNLACNSHGSRRDNSQAWSSHALPASCGPSVRAIAAKPGSSSTVPWLAMRATSTTRAVGAPAIASCQARIAAGRACANGNRAAYCGCCASRAMVDTCEEKIWTAAPRASAATARRRTSDTRGVRLWRVCAGSGAVAMASS